MTYAQAMECKALHDKITELKEQMAVYEYGEHIIETYPMSKRQKINEEYNRLNRLVISYTAKADVIENWISKVPDRVMQTYMYLRFVDGLTWKQIGARMNCKACTARKAVQRYMAKEERRNAGEHENDAD